MDPTSREWGQWAHQRPFLLGSGVVSDDVNLPPLVFLSWVHQSPRGEGRSRVTLWVNVGSGKKIRPFPGMCVRHGLCVQGQEIV